MPTIQLTADVSADALLRAVEQLDGEELDRFVSQVLALRARRQTRNGAAQEETLLQRIHRRLAPDVQRRYEELITKREARALSPEEHRELVQLGDRAEEADAERLGAVIELARLRQVPLDQLVRDLGLTAPPHG
jgi:hypothetical protein